MRTRILFDRAEPAGGSKLWWVLRALAAGLVSGVPSLLALPGPVANPEVDAGVPELAVQSVWVVSGDEEWEGLLRGGLTLLVPWDDRWALAAGFAGEDGPDEDWEMRSVVAGVRWQMWEEKEGAWASLAWNGGYVWQLEEGEDEVELRVLAQKRLGRWTHRLNVAFATDVDSGVGSDVDVGARWFTLWRVRDAIQPGMEWHADFGALDGFAALDEQDHYLGPALHGRIWKGEALSVQYQLAALFGLTEESADAVVRFRIEVEF